MVFAELPALSDSVITIVYSRPLSKAEPSTKSAWLYPQSLEQGSAPTVKFRFESATLKVDEALFQYSISAPWSLRTWNITCWTESAVGLPVSDAVPEIVGSEPLYSALGARINPLGLVSSMMNWLGPSGGDSVNASEHESVSLFVSLSVWLYFNLANKSRPAALSDREARLFNRSLNLFTVGTSFDDRVSIMNRKKPAFFVCQKTFTILKTMK